MVKTIKVREIVKRLKADGWYYVGSEGSHHHYEHPTKPDKVTIVEQSGDDVAIGTLKSIEQQSGLKLR